MPSFQAIAASARAHAKSVKVLNGRCVAIHGDNRLVLGDLPDESVQCTITSPPYGDQKNYGSPDEIGSGNTDYLGYLEDLKRIFAALHRITAKGGTLWIVLDTLKRDGRSIPLPFQAIGLASECGWSFQEAVIWDKGKSLPWSHPGHFRGVFEYVLLFSKGRIGHFNLDAVRDADHLSSYWVRYPERFNPLGKAPTDLWHIPIPVQGSWAQSDLRHLCPFPNELVRRMVALTTSEGDIVLDPFAGTGVVPAIATAMGREGVGIELNDRYYRAFVDSGFERILRDEAAKQHTPAHALAETIMTLRTLKLPKSLFAQMSRSDRLGDDVRQYVAAMLVNARSELVTRDNEKPTVDVAILARSEAGARKMRAIVPELVERAPLSKFGLVPDIGILGPKEWLADTFRPARRGEVWYKYQAGAFNTFSRQLTATELRADLEASADQTRTRVPPIYSRLAAQVRPGIED